MRIHAQLQHIRRRWSSEHSPPPTRAEGEGRARLDTHSRKQSLLETHKTLPRTLWRSQGQILKRGRASEAVRVMPMHSVTSACGHSQTTPRAMASSRPFTLTQDFLRTCPQHANTTLELLLVDPTPLLGKKLEGCRNQSHKKIAKVL